MSISPVPAPAAIGFRKIARLGTRRELVHPGRRRVDGAHGDRIVYHVDADAAARALWDASEPVTYMWIIAGDARPVYVGKATYGMGHRSLQHEGGFHGTAEQRRRQEEAVAGGQGRDVAAGLAHARRIRELWTAPGGRREVELWVRPSDRTTLFGCEGSLVSTEEEILISLFQPIWNTIHRSDPDIFA